MQSLGTKVYLLIRYSLVPFFLRVYIDCRGTWSDASFIWFKTMSNDHNIRDFWSGQLIYTIALLLYFTKFDLYYISESVFPEFEVFPKVAIFVWIFALKCDSQRLWNDLFSLACPWLLLQMVLILTNEMSTSHCWSLTRTRQTPLIMHLCFTLYSLPCPLPTHPETGVQS